MTCLKDVFNMNKIQDLIGICGFLGIYGTTGALECNTISIHQFAIRVVVIILVVTILELVLDFSKSQRKNKSKSK